MTGSIYNSDAYEAAIKRNIRENASKTRRKAWFAENADAAAIENYCYSKAYDSRYNSFWGDMRDAIAQWGALTDGQTSAVRNRMQQEEQRRNEWAEHDKACEWVGTVGERRQFDITVKHIIELEGMYGITHLHICRDDYDNVVIYIGSAFWGTDAKVSCMAKVKYHNERNGVKQTFIQRPTKVTVNGEKY